MSKRLFLSLMMRSENDAMLLTSSMSQGVIIRRYVERKMNLGKDALSSSKVDFEGILSVVIFASHYS